MREPERLSIEKSALTRQQLRTIPFNAGVLLLVLGVVVLMDIRFAVLWVILALALISLAYRARKQVDAPLGSLDDFGISYRPLYWRRPRQIPWTEIERVRISRMLMLASIRFEPRHGRRIAISLTGTSTPPEEIVAFARRHAPLGTVDAPADRPAGVRRIAALPDRIIIRPKLTRDSPITYVMIVVAASAILSVGLLLVITDTSMVLAAQFVLLVVLFMGVILLLIARSIRFELSPAGFRTVFGPLRRRYRWTDLKEIKRGVGQMGTPALRMIGFTPDDQAMQLPLSWSPIGEADLIAAIRQYAAPHTFEGP